MNLKPEPIYAEPLKPNKTATVINDTSAPGEYQPVSIFQQNREKWQKRASSTDISPAAVQQQSTILTRKNLHHPDLVMDLPPPSQQDSTTPPLSSGSTSASSSTISLDKQVEDPEEDMTLGEHFAKQNQCTLKKNEKFSENSPHGKKMEKSVSMSVSTVSSNNSLEDVVLRIDETSDTVSECGGSMDRLSTGSVMSSASLKIEMEKSPIPMRNTQKFVSKFADLKLTGGCSTIAKTGSVPSVNVPTKPEKPEKERNSFMASFRPQLKAKPQITIKKKSIFLQGHSTGGSKSEDPGKK